MSGNHIGILLRNLRDLRLLPDRVNQHLEIQRLIREYLPPSLARQISVGHLTAGTLTIHSNNGSCAAKIKHITPQIMPLLRAQGFQVNGIRVRVQALECANALSKKENLMTPCAQESIALLIGRLNESPLRSALARLASRKERRD